MEGLTHLGKQSSAPVTKLDLIPWKGKPITVTLHCTEFTSFCPVTSQPDFAELLIVYQPKEHLVETKSMKLYLQGYRNEKAFNEVLADKIAADLFEQIKPNWLAVEGKYHIRGGIAVTAQSQKGKRCIY